MMSHILNLLLLLSLVNGGSQSGALGCSKCLVDKFIFPAMEECCDVCRTFRMDWVWHMWSSGCMIHLFVKTTICFG
ncbi:hypothetical protein KP509_26G048000 [Ceratopteris richardii]|uniref:Secreted protein n=1 Tax=Ceratopteris richardii TaxID=49495 RepID=A0A8T2RKH0_CERRI|nr:hypothetical protein KP509_26G048000 [Ceratopteris richardii]